MLSLVLTLSASLLLPSQTNEPERSNPDATDDLNYHVELDAVASIEAILFSFPQRGGVVQVGVECVALPQCPDCTRAGNVCRGARQFYGGITAIIAKKNIIAECQRANALDYCGGSNGCMKLTSKDQQKHRTRYGGGCYPQCPRVAKCVVQYKNL